MEQFRQIGEVLGSIKALLVLKQENPINQRQCSLLFDLFDLAFNTIAEEINHNLKLEEKSTKWKALERPMKELHRIFKEGEVYIKGCVDTKDWWGKVISYHQNNDCVEFHIHNLLCCFPVVIEAIETDSEISGQNQDEMQKRHHLILRKYDSEWNDPKLFQQLFGKQYLVNQDICDRFDNARKEDRWFVVEKMREIKISATKQKDKQMLCDLLINKLNGSSDMSKTKLMSSWVLVGAKDYCVKKRLGSGRKHYKEIHWLGENFALRTFFGDIDESLRSEISLVLSISHPNIIQYHCGFYDDEKKEGFLVMDLMSKDLGAYIKENFSQRKRIPFSVPVAVDIMLQIARGMEYLHSKKIYHGYLNPSNVLLKVKNSSAEGYFHAKITGFGLDSVKIHSPTCTPSPNGADPVIWYAPEVLANDMRHNSKYSEKADVYSFGMLCFEILTGKVPFEDSHLQGEKMVRNILVGERPLFPHPSPKFLSNITRRCWHTNPVHRPSFSSICRILRYIKKILVINPDVGQPEAPPPLVDYCDLEGGYLKKFGLGERNSDLGRVSQIPFELFSYRLLEKEKNSASFKDKNWDILGDEKMGLIDDAFMAPTDGRSVYSEIIESKNLPMTSADERSVISEIPRRSFSFKLTSDQKPLNLDIPEVKLFPKDDSEILEGRVSLPVCSEKKLLISPRGVDRLRETPATDASISKPSDVKRTASPIRTNKKAVLTTPVTTPKVVCSAIPEKKVVVDDDLITASKQKDKKVSLKKRMQDAKNKIIPWTLKKNSTEQNQPGYTAKSSPAPNLKRHLSDKYQPAIRTNPTKSYNTGGYSPARKPNPAKSYNSGGYSPMLATKECLSPLQNPSTRSKVKQENNLPSFMSPTRHIKIKPTDSKEE